MLRKSDDHFSFLCSDLIQIYLFFAIGEYMDQGVGCVVSTDEERDAKLHHRMKQDGYYPPSKFYNELEKRTCAKYAHFFFETASERLLPRYVLEHGLCF